HRRVGFTATHSCPSIGAAGKPTPPLAQPIVAVASKAFPVSVLPVIIFVSHSDGPASQEGTHGRRRAHDDDDDSPPTEHERRVGEPGKVHGAQPQHPGPGGHPTIYRRGALAD